MPYDTWVLLLKYAGIDIDSPQVVAKKEQSHV